MSTQRKQTTEWTCQRCHKSDWLLLSPHWQPEQRPEHHEATPIRDSLMTEYHARRRELLLAFRQCRFCQRTAWTKVSLNVAVVFFVSTTIALGVIVSIHPVLLLAVAVPVLFLVPPLVGAGATAALVIATQVEASHLPLDPAEGRVDSGPPR